MAKNCFDGTTANMMMGLNNDFVNDFYKSKAPNFCRDFGKRLEVEGEVNDLQQQEVIDPMLSIAMNIHHNDHYLLSSDVHSLVH